MECTWRRVLGVFWGEIREECASRRAVVSVKMGGEREGLLRRECS